MSEKKYEKGKALVSDDDARQSLAVAFDLPHGFRFLPTDKELAVDYLLRKVSGESLHGMELHMKEVPNEEIYGSPPSKEKLEFCGVNSFYGQKVWFFFTNKNETHHNVFGSIRTVDDGTGYWKTITSEEPIYDGKICAFKIKLAFYTGIPPRGKKTCWLMEEYRLAEAFLNDNIAEKNVYILGKISRATIEKSFSEVSDWNLPLRALQRKQAGLNKR